VISRRRIRDLLGAIGFLAIRSACCFCCVRAFAGQQRNTKLNVNALNVAFGTVTPWKGKKSRMWCILPAECSVLIVHGYVFLCYLLRHKDTLLHCAAPWAAAMVLRAGGAGCGRCDGRGFAGSSLS